MIKSEFSKNDYCYILYQNIDEAISYQIWSIRNLQEVRECMDNSEQFSFDTHCKFIESLKKKSNVAYYAVLRKNEFCGSICLTDINFIDKSAEFGIFINPIYKGNNLAVNISHIFFNELNGIIDIYYARILKFNLTSQGFFRKLGFHKSNESDIHFIYKMKNI